MSDETPKIAIGFEKQDGEPKPTPPPKKEVPLVLPRLSADALRKLITEICDGTVFTSAQCRESDMGMVFMPILLGAFAENTKESLKQIGILYEYLSEAGPRSCNGYPCFFSFHMLHKDDWEIVRASIPKELERRKGVELVTPQGTDQPQDIATDLAHKVEMDIPTATAAPLEKP